MAAPTVTFSGAEVALLAGIIAGALPALDESDFDVADLLLDKALAALPRPIAPDLGNKIAHLRIPPLDRFRIAILARFPSGSKFNLIDASIVGKVRPSRAFTLLETLALENGVIQRAGSEHWTIGA
ncbi:MAG: hypothetical protein Tp170SUR191951_77 [Prokaryotic dsDNA virus sp.]|nr:hypothetical protein [Pseudomonas sp.]MBS67372.1 hypothetical protein [Pseudomonas sp.]QDP55239.1 MAG: hypothetical protein Tp170SUR191951_77 [Prokaryotic dsDNA virus sp.]